MRMIGNAKTFLQAPFGSFGSGRLISGSFLQITIVTQERGGGDPSFHSLSFSYILSRPGDNFKKYVKKNLLYTLVQLSTNAGCCVVPPQQSQ